MKIEDILKKFPKNIFRDLGLHKRSNSFYITFRSTHAAGLMDYISFPMAKKARDKYLDSLVDVLIDLRLSNDKP